MKVYRVKSKDKYFWIASNEDNFEDAFKRKITSAKHLNKVNNKLSEIDSLILNGKINEKVCASEEIGESNSFYKVAGILKEDLCKFDVEEIYGQRIAMLMFYGIDLEKDISECIEELVALMNRYYKVDFNFPTSKKVFEKIVGQKSSENKFKEERRKVINYWYNSNNLYLKIIDQENKNKLRAQGLSREQVINYNSAFTKLENTNTDKEWYKSQDGKVKGLIWHFTDINNMANILSYMKIASKNYTEKNKLVKNNNASTKVNDELTKKWVHDYARFYFRPETPTQYRNEGIFGKETERAKPNKRLLKDGELWTAKPAHLPVPIFISFSFKEFLKRGGIVTKRSLAGNSIPESKYKEKIFDRDLLCFENNVENIYGKKNGKNFEKQTEFIMWNYLKFNPEDIVNIFVRTEAEKLALLTLLAEHNIQYFNTKSQHRKIDISKYIDKIKVNPRIFELDAGKLDMREDSKEEKNFYHKTISNLKEADCKIYSEEYSITKLIGERKLKISIQKLKRITINVTDINNEEKLVGVFHNPDWILSTNKWKKLDKHRYYTDLYYKGTYLKVWRNLGEDKWYNVKNDEEVNFSEKEKNILSSVEESYKII